MATRIVDVFLKDGLVESHELTGDIVNTPLFDEDFTDRAAARLGEDGYTSQQIAEARLFARPAAGKSCPRRQKAPHRGCRAGLRFGSYWVDSQPARR